MYETKDILSSKYTYKLIVKILNTSFKVILLKLAGNLDYILQTQSWCVLGISLKLL